MALLLVKRHTKEMGAGQKAIIYVSGHDSLSDIKRFLLKQSFKWICEELDGYFRVQVIKGTLSSYYLALLRFIFSVI